MLTTRGLLMDYEKERKSVSSQEREMPISGTILEELHGKAQRGILVDVEHGKAHRTNKEKTNTSQSEKFVTEGNEKADELAKAGSDQCWMKDFWQKQKQKLCSKKEKICVRHCSMRAASIAWKNNGKTVKSSGQSRKKSGFSWKRKAII